MIWAVKHRADPTSAAPPPTAQSEDPLHAYGQRWASGEGIAGLAKEASMSWNRLWSELTKLGYTKGA